jgi:hypothetical protein
MTIMHVPLIPVTRLKDVSTLQNLVMTTMDALLTLATMQRDASTLLLFVTITMHVPMISAQTDAVHTTQSKLKQIQTNVSSTCATRRTEDIPEISTVTTTIHVLKTAVTHKLEFALTKVKLVMTMMHVPLIAAILLLDNAKILQSLALMETHVLLILATKLKDVSTLQNIT